MLVNDLSLFFIKLITKSEKVYELPISVDFQKYLPQACLLFEKKNISVEDENKLLEAIVRKENLFEYMNKEDYEDWN